MEKKEYKIKSFEELLSIFDEIEFIDVQAQEDVIHSSLPLIYRGMSNINWGLKPSVGRLENYSVDLEQELLSLFRRGARPYLEFQPRNELEWISLAQHHGLPTRLLDWTKNPLVAIFFAVETNSQMDSVVYAMSAENIIDASDPRNYEFSPLQYIGGAVACFPEHLTTRIIAQQGQFTLHGHPNENFDGWLKKIVIPNSVRQIVKYRLMNYGIDRSTLFPGLDGLAQAIVWEKTANKKIVREYILSKANSSL